MTTARRIRITAGRATVDAELNDTRAATAVWQALPLAAKAETWGDEVYFETSLTLPEEHPRAVVDRGDVGYWPPGRALCLFYGPTPASRGDEIRPASPVTVIGRIVGDTDRLRAVRPGDPVRVERADGPGGPA